METAEGSQRTAVERFGSGGMALLPWTRQMLTVLWEQLRLLLQVIYYSFVSVFQMFRFEVHVRITDETGQHIQHMTTTSSSPESFLFSSLFDGDSSVMVGSSNPLSNFCADVGDPFTGKSPAEALLSSLRADDLCCGLVDDFVSRASATEEKIFLGHQSSWKMGFPHDWNIFVSSAENSGSSDSCQQEQDKVFRRHTTKEKVFKQDTPEDEISFHWSSEEDQNLVEFDSEESEALWESLSKSTDPYNPFFFSACISTTARMGKNKTEAKECTEPGRMSINKACEEVLNPQGLNIWLSRSDSESSWTSSDGSSSDMDREESERLWDFFSAPSDPYNPMCFTASTVSSTAPSNTKHAPLPPPPPDCTADIEEDSVSFHASSEEDEEDKLWRSLSRKDDPYHPLNFRASLRSSPHTPPPQPSAPQRPHVEVTEGVATHERKRSKASKKQRAARPGRSGRQQTHHRHPEETYVPWRRPLKKDLEPSEGNLHKRQNRADSTQKKVHFSPHVHVHVMRSWPFARQASRKGLWEEMARDRSRFQRRIQETEQAIGHCLSPSHRERAWARLQRGALT